jgi:hypothetical protein
MRKARPPGRWKPIAVRPTTHAELLEFMRQQKACADKGQTKSWWADDVRTINEAIVELLRRVMQNRKSSADATAVKKERRAKRSTEPPA